jgi:hypothetical protein
MRVQLIMIDSQSANYALLCFQEKDASLSSVEGTVRVFIAPKFDENFQQYGFEDQRSLFFDLDQFKIQRNMR